MFLFTSFVFNYSNAAITEFSKIKTNPSKNCNSRFSHFQDVWLYVARHLTKSEVTVEAVEEITRPKVQPLPFLGQEPKITQDHRITEEIAFQPKVLILRRPGLPAGPCWFCPMAALIGGKASFISTSTIGRIGPRATLAATRAAMRPQPRRVSLNTNGTTITSCSCHLASLSPGDQAQARLIPASILMPLMRSKHSLFLLRVPTGSGTSKQTQEILGTENRQQLFNQGIQHLNYGCEKGQYKSSSG